VSDVVDLDGQMVSAMALGWNGAETDDTDWALYPTDLPLLTTQHGILTVNYVDGLDYTQFVVNGVPVDPGTVTASTFAADSVLVASGWEGVPRDEDGKWTTGPGGIGTVPLTPSPGTPGQIPLWTKQQESAHKAVATKKAKAAHAKQVAGLGDQIEKAQAVAKAANEAYEATPQYEANGKMNGVIESIRAGTAAVPTSWALENASPDFVDDYLKTTLGDSYAKKVGDTVKSANEKRNMAQAVAVQHGYDQMALADIGYSYGKPPTAVEARRAVLRETGERKPTGGPGSGQATHTFYGDATIRAMTKEKQAAIIVHHTGGTAVLASVMELSDQAVADRATDLDHSYMVNVSLLTKKGVDPSAIPHSAFGAGLLTIGATKGLKPLAAAKVSTTVTTSPTTLGKPANWASMTPGKKAAWTKKHGPGATAPTFDVPHPAEWASMTSGKKAAWTKKHKLGGVVATHTASTKAKDYTGAHPLGDEHIHSADSASKATTELNAHITALPNFKKHETARLTAFKTAIDTPMFNAWDSYTGTGHGAMNQLLKTHGANYKGSTKVNALRDAIVLHGSPAPMQLYRGKRRLGPDELNLHVGDVYEDRKFGSWSTDKETAKGFGGIGTYNMGGQVGTFYHLVDSKGVRSIPSQTGEYETIIPPGTKYRVLAIDEFNSSSSATSNKLQYRVIKVEVVHAPFG